MTITNLVGPDVVDDHALALVDSVQACASSETIARYRRYVRDFLLWADSPDEVRHHDVERYIRATSPDARARSILRRLVRHRQARSCAFRPASPEMTALDAGARNRVVHALARAAIGDSVAPPGEGAPAT